jgi:ABC-type branched-subunit amino acid transport system ATPase component
MTILVLIVALALAWVVRNIQRSASGRAMLAARSSALGAAASGISLPRVRLLLFGASAALAGLGGVLYASSVGQISTSDFSPEIGLVWLAVMVSFGVSRPAFALVAGVVYSVFPQFVSYVTTSTVIPQILFGLGGVVLARHPEGFMAQAGTDVGRLVRRVTRRTRPDSAAAAPEPPTKASAVANDRAEPVTAVAGQAPALALSGICAGYGASQVLHGVDLQVPAGRIVAIVGANGAGKSTLCAVTCGLVTPRAGSVALHGADVTGAPPHQRARQGLAYAPEARGVFPGLSVDDNLKLMLAAAEDRDAVYARFPTLGHRRKLAAGALSGGEQQMLALAPLFQQRPSVLLADEPALGLAPMVVGQVHALLAELRDTGMAIVLVEERVGDVLAIADDLIILELGRVAWRGPAAHADADRITAAYLGADVE